MAPAAGAITGHQALTTQTFHFRPYRTLGILAVLVSNALNSSRSMVATLNVSCLPGELTLPTQSRRQWRTGAISERELLAVNLP